MSSFKSVASLVITSINRFLMDFPGEGAVSLRFQAPLSFPVSCISRTTVVGHLKLQISGNSPNPAHIHLLMFHHQDHEKGITDAHLSRESEKAKNLKNEAESYSSTLKDIINTVSRAQAAMGLDCTLDPSLREIPRPGSPKRSASPTRDVARTGEYKQGEGATKNTQ